MREKDVPGAGDKWQKDFIPSDPLGANDQRAITMKREVYDRIFPKLRTVEDVDRIASEEGLDRELVYVLYSQRTVRRATKRYYRIKHAAPSLVGRWKKGESFVQLADREDFPPMLMAFILTQEMGYSKKVFWRYVKEEVKAPSKRLGQEFQEARRVDRLYSPEANEEQDDRGRKGEERLAYWLDGRGVKYRTEEDLRGHEHVKTPDFLLDEPLKIDGFKYHWFESKAIFADDLEYKRHIRNQLTPYYDLYGTGAVAYWLGYLDDLKAPEGIQLLGPEFFER